jgi:hypothetical protein
MAGPSFFFVINDLEAALKLPRQASQVAARQLAIGSFPVPPTG